MKANISLDQDLVVTLEVMSREQGKTFDQVVNSMIRRGLDSSEVPDSLYPFTIIPNRSGFVDEFDPEKRKKWAKFEIDSPEEL